MKKLILTFFILSKFQAAAAASSSYQGKLIDATTQWPHKLYSLKQLDEKLKLAHVDKAGIYINSFDISASLAEKSSKEIDADSNFFKGSPKYFHLKENLTNKKVDELIKEIQHNKYLFVSEIMYRHADKKQGLTTKGGERAIDPLSPESLYLIKKIDDNFPNLPVLIHWEFYDWNKDLPVFEKLFNMFPAHTFILNHMGFGNPDQIKTLIRNHSNLFFTISKRNTKFEYFKNATLSQGAPLMDAQKKINQDWFKLFKEYPDKFLFATDSHKDYMWDNYSSVVQDYRIILGQLPTNVSEAVAFKNAEKIFKLAP